MLRPGLPSQGRPQQVHRPAGAARLTTRLSSRSSFICSSMGSLPRLCCCASAAALAQCLLNLMPPSLSSTGDVSPLPLKSTSAGLFLSPQSLSLSSIQLCVFFFSPPGPLSQCYFSVSVWHQYSSPLILNLNLQEPNSDYIYILTLRHRNKAATPGTFLKLLFGTSSPQALDFWFQTHLMPNVWDPGIVLLLFIQFLWQLCCEICLALWNWTCTYSSNSNSILLQVGQLFPFKVLPLHDFQ